MADVPSSDAGLARRLGPAERRRAMVVAVFVLALAVRMAAVLWLGGFAPTRNDRTLRYEPIASSLMAGDGFAIDGRPVAAAPPVYPLLLAGVYTLTGPSPVAIRSVLALIDAFQCVLFFAIARQLLGERTALVTGLALAVCPYLVYHVMTAGNDILFVFFHTLFLLAWVATRTRPAAWRWGLVGGSLAVATLTRAVALLLPLPVIALMLTDHRRDLRRGLAFACIFVGCFAAVLTPWTVRNLVQFSRFVPVQTLGGYHLLLATRAPAAPSGPASPSRHPVPDSSDVQVDGSYYHQAIRRILDDPATYVRAMGRRFVEMWYRTDSRRFQGLLMAANGALLALAAAGWILARERRRSLLPALLVVAYYIGLHTVVFAMFRYLLPAVPVLVMLAAAAVCRIVARPLAGGVGQGSPEAGGLAAGGS